MTTSMLFDPHGFGQELFSAEPPRVLIVEDERVVALDIQHRLTKLGFTVVDIASSGETAAHAVAAHSPDLVLMDIMLEGEMDGIDAAAAIRSTIDIPIIYISAFSDEELLERAQITEPFGYIIKPFEDRELATTIRMALYKHAMDDRLRRNERWLATTLHSMGEAVVSTDREGRIRFMNPVAELLTGVQMGECSGQFLTNAMCIQHETSGEDLGRLISQTLRNNRDFCLQEPALLTDNNCVQRPVALSASAIMSDGLHNGSNGAIYGAVLVLRDMSESRSAEAALLDSVQTLRRTVDETVAALAMTTEKRDPYTAGHQSRVATLAEAMARDMGMEEEQIQGLRVAALLHDLGKLYIPAEILSKPARLTVHEMNLMKTHPEAGYDILQGITFPWPVADIVLQHHERLDGSGYPHGKRDGEILDEAKIIAVADVVEAMSSHRPYRAALGMHVALEEIEMHQGTRYDPLAVRHCVRLFRDKDFTIV